MLLSSLITLFNKRLKNISVILKWSILQAKDGLVVLFKKFDDGRAVYEGDISKDAMLEFIQRYAVPLVRICHFLASHSFLSPFCHFLVKFHEFELKERRDCERTIAMHTLPNKNETNKMYKQFP